MFNVLRPRFFKSIKQIQEIHKSDIYCLQLKLQEQSVLIIISGRPQLQIISLSMTEHSLQLGGV